MNAFNRSARRPLRGPQASQRGVVLFVALIVLVAMTLAGLALMRQMGAGSSIAGNVAFKENATSVADRGVEVAREWIITNKTVLNVDAAASGYYASWGTSVDPTTYDWSTGASGDASSSDLANTGNATRYIIHRLCEFSNKGPNDPGQNCSDGVAQFPGESVESCGYSCPNFTPLPGPFYRITARVVGPRNTYSYVQVVMK